MSRLSKSHVLVYGMKGTVAEVVPELVSLWYLKFDFDKHTYTKRSKKMGCVWSLSYLLHFCFPYIDVIMCEEFEFPVVG